MLDEATADCYDEEEAFTGVLISVDENVAWPLRAELAGMPVEVLGLDGSASGLRRGLVAHIRRDGEEYQAGLVDLTFADVEATSAEWLALARWWAAQW